MNSLFDPPLVHTNDPLPSHLALEFLIQSGKLGKGEAIVLTLAKTNPARTAIELWSLATTAQQSELKEPQRVRQRLHSLMLKGKVKQVGQRSCTVRGSTQTTWEAT